MEQGPKFEQGRCRENFPSPPAKAHLIIYRRHSTISQFRPNTCALLCSFPFGLPWVLCHVTARCQPARPSWYENGRAYFSPPKFHPSRIGWKRRVPKIPGAKTLWRSTLVVFLGQVVALSISCSVRWKKGNKLLIKFSSPPPAPPSFCQSFPSFGRASSSPSLLFFLFSLPLSLSPVSFLVFLVHSLRSCLLCLKFLPPSTFCAPTI